MYYIDSLFSDIQDDDVLDFYAEIEFKDNLYSSKSKSDYLGLAAVSGALGGAINGLIANAFNTDEKTRLKLLKKKIESGEDLSKSDLKMISDIKKSRLYRVGLHSAPGAGATALSLYDKTGYISKTAGGAYNGAAVGAMTNAGTNQRLKSLIAKEIKGTMTRAEKEEYDILRAKRKNRVNLGAGIGAAVGAGSNAVRLTFED